MPTQRPESTQTLFNSQHEALKHIFQACKQQKLLSTAIKQQLPEKLAEHVEVLRVHDKTLILAAADSHWAGKLRLVEQDLLSKLRKTPQFSSLKAIKHQVQPLMRPELLDLLEEKPRDFQLDPENADMLKLFANSSDNAKLKTAIENFLKHHANR